MKLNQWDTEKISNEYFRQAREAERYCREIKAKINTTSTYKSVFDEHMAKFYVYSHLYEKTFLKSKATLMSELKSMLSQKAVPVECFDLDRFHKEREIYINYELHKLQNR